MSADMPRTLAALLAPKAADAPAIGAPGRGWLTHGALRNLGTEVRQSLHGLGIDAADRVAIVLPNGAEMATAFLTVAQAATTAPLNPGYTRTEFDFFLTDLRARALIVAAGSNGPAEASARALGMTVLRLEPIQGPAGGFRLTGEGALRPARLPTEDDVALILHTSGTTSRPKIVPLLQSNLWASARNIVAALDLTPADRSLNVMPLFHIHGLVASLLASLAAGGSVFCTPGFDALGFFGWMDEARPTWVTAVPTMHQAILGRAVRNRATIAAHPLRFLRSSSAALPGQVMSELAATFGVPVIEAYGMTEAAHQMTSNPLAPGAQRQGSVGRAAGPLVRIADETEDRLIEGTGEVVIAGDNVMPGYESNDEANRSAFFGTEGQRWLRTGDQGWIDAEGYLRLSGRLKEIINRGGEKISPLEVDNVLMDHPAIAQVVTFAAPHASLGEEVAAAVVLREGHSATERDIRDFCALRIAGFKVPRRIIFLAELPKGATGKLQRIGLAKTLGLAG